MTNRTPTEAREAADAASEAVRLSRKNLIEMFKLNPGSKENTTEWDVDCLAVMILSAYVEALSLGYRASQQSQTAKVLDEVLEACKKAKLKVEFLGGEYFVVPMPDIELIIARAKT